VVFASDDVRNFHFYVVDHVDKMKDPRSVRTPNSHVRICAAVEFNPATNEIIDDHRFPGRPETNGALIHIDDPLCLQQIQVPLVDRIPLALEIGAVVAAASGALVPIEAEPAQTLVNCLHRLVSLPALVRVLYSQQKRSMIVPGEKPVK